ncbi:sel1 repeat family protein, partial [Photobacterium japonica]
VPAMYSLFYFQDIIGKENGSEWINRALELGYPDAAKSLYYSYENGKRGVVKNKKYEYYYNSLAIHMKSGLIHKPKTKELIRDENNIIIRDKDGNATYKVLITPKEQAEMDKKAEDFLQRVKPNRYLDETTHELFRKYI